MYTMVKRSHRYELISKRFEASSNVPGMLDANLQEDLSKLRGLSFNGTGMWVTVAFGATCGVLMTLVI
ncbi:hypothetical protein FOA52_005813 [Chlamydomonas sp. UWO 241]|nr:hypothetical protein FOA52_005813 [Chlamydomonas sp. UWO 241]